MNNEIRELSMDELDLVSGGKDLIDYAMQAAKAAWAAIQWLRAPASPSPGDVQYSTTGRGDNSGCTGHQC